MTLRRTITLLLSMILVAGFATAQDMADGGGDAVDEAAASALDLGMDLAIGAQSFPNPDYDPTAADPGDPSITYQSVSANPDLGFGKFGLGLNLTINYRFTAGDGNEFEIRREDWVPDDDTSFLELYLPKLRYLRWGLKGEPLYVLLGTVDNGILGNGFILGGYSNGQHLPERRLFGMSLDVDGDLFSFPYVGVESFVGNLAAFDLIGGRLFVRPLIWSSFPIVKDLQIGATVAMDRQPFYFAQKEDGFDAATTPYLPADGTVEDAQVMIWGVDFRQPILANPLISLATFGDYVMQQASSGGMLGAGGRIAGIVTYGAQLRFLGDNFIPVYFDPAYDLFRPEKYAVYSGVATIPGYVGWFASMGFALLDDAIMFNAAIDGPFNADDPTDPFQQPHLRGTLSVAEGLLGGFSFEASYDKKGIESLADLINPEDAVIGARVNYKTGPAVISLVYDLKYDPYAPGDDPWVVTSGLETSIELF